MGFIRHFLVRIWQIIFQYLFKDPSISAVEHELRRNQMRHNKFRTLCASWVGRRRPDGDAKQTIGLICKSTHFFGVTPRRGRETVRLNVYAERNLWRTNFTSFFWSLVYYWGVNVSRFVTNLDHFGIRFVFSSRRGANPEKSRPSLVACLQLVDL